MAFLSPQAVIDEEFLLHRAIEILTLTSEAITPLVWYTLEISYMFKASESRNKTWLYMLWRLWLRIVLVS